MVVIAGSVANPLFAQTDLPPIAAPTTSVAVEILPIVRSESQQVSDYARGLVEGLMAREEISYGALVIVTRDRVDIAEAVGEDVGENALFALGSLSDLFGVVSVMQLVEQARLYPAQDLAAVLGEAGPRGATLAELLTQRVGGSSAILEDVVERASGADYGAYLSTQILAPLGMARSRFENNVGMLVTAGDMSQFLKAFTHQDALREGRFLLPATIELMQRTHYSDNAALPGWAYGFAEMKRNGWRALQRDGLIAGPESFQSRIVIVPELQIAYFVSFSDRGSPEFWRALDDNLFDRLAPSDVAAPDLAVSSESSAERAMALAGLYRPRVDMEQAIFLKAKREPLRVEADGAVLRLSGAENLMLQPMPGGAWRAETTLIPAAFDGGVFRVGSLAYVPIRAWQSPGNYLVLAGIFGMLTFIALLMRGYAPTPAVLGTFSSPKITVGLAGITVILVALAVVLRSWT
jgi:CubicO group peptidase (beta-lactamase class C family)